MPYVVFENKISMSSLNPGGQTTIANEVEVLESTMREVTSSFGSYGEICTKQRLTWRSHAAVNRLEWNRLLR